jgi:curli biogenesis system outer membrane secretion channel CsgG
MKKLFLAIFCAIWIQSTYAQQQIVAINKFENEANAQESLFQTLRSRITDNIINTRKFEVVERDRLEAVMSERNLADAGLLEEGTAPEAGKIKAAGWIIYGSVLSLGVDADAATLGNMAASKVTAKVEIQLRLADASTGSIKASKTIISTKSQSRMVGDGRATAGNISEQVLTDAIRDASQKITEALMELAYPVKVIKVNRADMIVTMTKEQAVPDSVYEVFAPGEGLIDPDTGISLGSSEEYIGRVVVKRSMPKFTIMEPADGSKIEDFSTSMILRRQSEEDAKRERKREEQKRKRSFESRF